TITALGGDVDLEGVPAVEADASASFQEGSISGTYKDGIEREAVLMVDANGADAGDLLSWDLGDPDLWEVGSGMVVTRGLGYKGYVGQAPDEVEIDGAFGDWAIEKGKVVEDPAGDPLAHPDGPSEVVGLDLSMVSAQVGTGRVALYAEVEDGMLAGTLVPHVPGSTPEGALDIDGDGRLDVDGDGVEDGLGTSDRDWDNDAGEPDDPGTPFKDTGEDDEDEDDDNDGIPDWNDPTRGGPHVPGPPSDLPPLLGTDVVEFLIDTDGDGATGFSPDGFQLGADRRVLIEGRNGAVRNAVISVHTGETTAMWSWSEVAGVDHAMDGTRLEVGVDARNLAMDEGFRLLVRAIGWAGTKDWSDNLLEGTGNETEPLKVGGEVGAIDPFTVTTAGGFSISPDGSSWTQEDGPTDGGAVVDVATGYGPLAGYVYLLTSKGRVMVSTRATEGWTQYGQGLPN
ncbi:MAG: hypothetical protein GWN18_14205, partial [Thermoplasmata archaeon]|nr:hypothetical protein [Thermoplasmata archaeon]NIS13215.1 hypothetical protein [Thermoplasmata archaeon]NIS21108.1 hypothetical protein [Thermoplasmata archaeon]NIT78583.1 hypothetical protein [Thermoplasmata archaeon]NIU50159.1 hypothetical protein [Thermoplasmata archaeon]